MPTVGVKITESRNTDKLLAGMPVELREKHLRKALRRGANEQAKEARRLAPKPGYPGDKPGRKPLNRTIGTVVRLYEHHVVAVTGPRWPEGAHGHLVEFGHFIKRTTPGPTRTRPVPFMRKAADTTVGKQHTAVVKSLQNDLQDLAN